MAVTVTEQSFDQEVLQSEKPVIVDFWAEWCGPCHAVSPVLEKIAAEREGELKLVKVNIDEERELSDRYGVASIPTMILFKDGEPAAAVVGGVQLAWTRPSRPVEAQRRLRVGALAVHIHPQPDIDLGLGLAES